MPSNAPRTTVARPDGTSTRSSQGDVAVLPPPGPQGRGGSLMHPSVTGLSQQELKREMERANSPALITRSDTPSPPPYHLNTMLPSPPHPGPRNVANSSSAPSSSSSQSSSSSSSSSASSSSSSQQASSSSSSQPSSSSTDVTVSITPPTPTITSSSPPPTTAKSSSLDNLAQLHPALFGDIKLDDDLLSPQVQTPRQEEEKPSGLLKSKPTFSRSVSNLGMDRSPNMAKKIVLALVGMPARGKSYIAKKLNSYLNWRGIPTKIFNVGSHRRTTTKDNQSSEFFDPNNAKAIAIREQWAEEVLGNAFDYLRREGSVAIFDATNTTRERRQKVNEICANAGVMVIFVESICNDEKVITSNFRMKIKFSPDYRDMPEEQAVADLAKRIENYAKAYKTIADDENLCYIKLINLNSKVICYQLHGRLPRSMLFYCMNLHIHHRPVWLCRAGHVDDIGRDGVVVSQNARRGLSLSDKGKQFARRLADFVRSHEPTEPVWYDKGDYYIFTSTVKRAVETVQYLDRTPSVTSALNMRDHGAFDGLTEDAIKAKHPDVYDSMTKDPFYYRYPSGESYADVVQRLDIVVNEIERLTKPVLVVSHLSCLRALYSYFHDLPITDCLKVDFPQHTIVELNSTQYGWSSRVVPLEPEMSRAIS